MRSRFSTPPDLARGETATTGATGATGALGASDGLVSGATGWVGSMVIEGLLHS